MERVETVERTMRVRVAAVAGIAVGLLCAVWLLAHPESPVLVFVAMVGFALFTALAVVLTVVWAVQWVRGRRNTGS
jgi:xanthosine utilization system XapX-like protein